MADFFSENDWVLNYLPAQSTENKCVHPSLNDSWYKTMIEKLLQNKLGDWLDNRFMKITAVRWKRKEYRHQKNMKGDPVGLRISKHCARPNPEHLQKKLLGMLSAKLQKMEADHLLRKEMI